ncbi:hypothetical protein FRC12_003441 [Ceratobasidium sp. 428]|nr:hypothetical protein FRC12_003441 [Ceratobasidium sp. 428]
MLGLRGYNGWLPSNPHRYNGWLPSSRAVHQAFISDLLARATARHNRNEAHEPCVAAFDKAMNANNGLMKRLFEKTFIEATSTVMIPDYPHLLHALDVIVVSPPAVVNLAGEPAEPIGVPIYVAMDPLINTSAGYLLFTMDSFNNAMKPLLDSWGQYLKSPASNATLTDVPDGWFGQEGISLLQAADRGTFNNTYITPDPSAVNRGYGSWDAFFTREVQDIARPVHPAPPGTVIYNACESTVERYVTDVQLHDKFWLKGMPYSLYDMFGGDASQEHIARQFEGGTVYQAFLSPEDYHRWHAPVAGIIVDAYVLPGTYYAALPDDGDDGDMRGALIRSQPWLTAAAARAVVTIKSEIFGLVCLIAVGMVEVSTCELLVKSGDPVEPGKQLGMFHFGGSSHALIFQKHVNIAWRNPVKPGVHRKVNSILADVTISQRLASIRDHAV